VSTEQNVPPPLFLPKECFSADVLTRQAKAHGFSQANTLEALLWAYEIFCQMQQRAGDMIRLTGGGATQLFVQPERQRASVDIDILTSLDQTAIESLLTDITRILGDSRPYFVFQPYDPAAPATVEGLHSHTVLVPTAMGQKWRMQDGAMIEARMIKVDVHQLHALPPGHAREARIAGMDLGVAPLTVGIGYLIAEKLLTQARGTVGVPNTRYQDLPKHLYDLDSLTMQDAAGALAETAQWLPDVIAQQGTHWRKREGLASICDDLEASLSRFAVVDYAEEREVFQRAVSQLETLYLPRGSRWRLHQWATKAARMLAIVRLLRPAILDGERFRPEVLGAFERLAVMARTHGEPAAITRTLYSQLPSQMRTVRALKGSPPERLYWMLATQETLGGLERTLS